jgi:signal transduction histidine kinase
MGARPLEARLRTRLALLLGPICAGVGLASVLITARALDAVDSDAAKVRAEAALRMLHEELSEGDAPETALHEVLVAADSDGVLVRIRGPGFGAAQGRLPVPESFARMAPGTCGGEGEWRGCAVASGGLEAMVAVPVTAHREVLRTLALSMVGVVALFLACVAVAVRSAVKGPVAGLVRLLRWSEEVIERGEPQPAPAAGTVEVDRLTLAFDQVVRRLFDALGRERANSAHIAHELRNPLTALRADLERMQAEGDARAPKLLADVERLSRVIDAILVLSAPRGPRADAPAVVNVADLARSLAPAGTEVLAPDEALVEADEKLVELALTNLLDNAKKYSGRPARRIAVTRDGEGVRIAIQDDGPGLDEASRAHMFDRYWRGDTDGEGSGLGLALVRAVAERHGGEASARPNEGGPGLEVSLTLAPVVAWQDAHEERAPR